MVEFSIFYSNFQPFIHFFKPFSQISTKIQSILPLHQKKSQYFSKNPNPLFPGRWSDEFYFQNTPRMFSESLNNLPSLEHAKHNSVVVFQNGSIFHIFKAKNFLQLRSEGLFREKAYSLTFYGSDTTQVPIKKDLFTGKE